ncbi:olfactory receptor 5G29-like [Phyllobates terribilis]|uniref:olfactory receptor 5G29-like n=1 Tax=Phyllobates terribilis TaxID=111132 RepID=UPI003CCB0B84
MIPGLNLSSVNEFFIVGFEYLHNFRIAFFIVLLLIYMATLAGNLLIISLVSTTPCLQTPMYIFLSQLSLSDIILTSTICPNTLLVIFNDGSTISKIGCITQLFIFSMSMVTECLLLTVMSFDRYVAICSLATILVTILIVSLDFCGSNIVVNHFFCDYGPLLQLSCSDTSLLETVVIIITTNETIIETVFIFSTYVCIVRSILKISTTTGKKTSTMNKILSLLYTVVTPLLNPIIYSLKNLEIRITIMKRFNKLRQILT